VLAWFAALMTAAGLFLAALAAYVGWRRGTRAGLALGVLLLSVAWWGLAYAVELSASDVATKSLWGDLKYFGVCTLAPAWLVFVLQYTGRARQVTRRMLAVLALVPVGVLVTLFVPATHALVRSYPADAAGETVQDVSAGPVFWLHLVYANAVILVATALFVTTMVRLSRTYRFMAVVLVAAALLPWVGNLLYNFDVGWFSRLDLTPFAFTVTGAVLVWGLFREGLVRIAPLARGVIVENMGDGVFILDAFGRLADVNSAGVRLLGASRAELIGRSLADVLVRHADLSESHAGLQPGSVADGRYPSEVTVSDGDRRSTFDVRREPLDDRRGRPAGELVILRDITARARAEQALEQVLAERSRVAAALQQSLIPARLPTIAGCEVAGCYEPAGDGSEIGGDFYDVFPTSDHTWGVMLGDVSGKGAEAAAVTALARYTLRAFAEHRRPPSRTLHELNARLLVSTETERFCTLVYAQLQVCDDTVEMNLSLAGHHPPLLARAGGGVEGVGRLGTAVGLLEETEFHDVRVRLGPGDLICLFTDGLVEASDGTDLFGSERVADLLADLRAEPLEDIAAELTAAARRFHGPDLADDVAILLLRAEATRTPESRVLPQARGRNPDSVGSRAPG